MIRTVVAFVAGLMSVVLVTAAGGRLWQLSSMEWGRGSPPDSLGEHWAMLSVACVSGIVGALVIVLICRRVQWPILMLFAAVGVIVDGMASLGPLENTPLWFRLLLTGTVPLQVWIGAQLGRAIIGEERPTAALNVARREGRATSA